MGSASLRTLYWRAIRRVERRAARVRALRPLGYSLAPVLPGSPVWSHCADCERAQVLLRDACRLANRLDACDRAERAQ